MSRPMVNPALIAGGNGSAFRVVYVGTQGGASDKLYAISRTNGGVVREYAASGTLEHGNLYWDSTNARYNLFFRQGNGTILALTDDGGTITTNAGWSENPLNMTNLIGRPVRIFDDDRQNYLMVLVTSFQGNTSTLYKIRAADGAAVADQAGYSASAAAIGWNPGLRSNAHLYPLWVNGTTFSLSADNSGPIKIPASGGGTAPSFGATTIANIFVDSPTYTRSTFSTGERILFAHEGHSGGSTNETAARINLTNMQGVEWTSTGILGFGEYITNLDDDIDTAPYSPPFGTASPVPIFIGAEDKIHRLSGSGGTQETNFPFALAGAINTEILFKGDWMYFGTADGTIYLLSKTDPTQGIVSYNPDNSAVVGVAIDSTNSFVYYTTANGKIYQFDTQ